MAPLVRRTWAPVGQTPILHQRTRCHQKVSLIAALGLNSRRTRLHLYFRLHPHTNITAREVQAFLRHLLRQIRRPIVLVWDRLQAHRARRIQDFLHRHPRLHIFFLPPYAPELNPVESFWSYLKINPLANLAVEDVDLLAALTRSYGRGIQRQQSLLRSFLRHAPLPLRLG